MQNNTEYPIEEVPSWASESIPLNEEDLYSGRYDSEVVMLNDLDMMPMNYSESQSEQRPELSEPTEESQSKQHKNLAESAEEIQSEPEQQTLTESQFDQIEIEFDAVRSQERKTQPMEETLLAASSQATEEPKPVEQKKAPEKISGEISIDYTFERFNANSEYTEVKQSKLNLFNRNESIFEHKNDGSRITIKKNKIVCDNTERNLHAVIDIAQDKGWDVIKITGGSKSAKAEMWYIANLRGLETTGYEPTEADKKRLLGAQERARKEQDASKGENLAEALDIKPKKEEKTITPSPSSAAPSKEPESDNKAAAKESHEISDAERFNRVKKEIMAEVEKIFPMNEKEYTHLENSIDEQLTLLMQKGKPNDIQKFKEGLRNGLPTLKQALKQELGNAARMEHQQAKTAHQQEQKHKPETRER